MFNKCFIVTGNLYIGSNYIKTFFTIKPEMTALMADAIDNCNSKASTVSVPEVRINQLVLDNFYQSDGKNAHVRQKLTGRI